MKFVECRKKNDTAKQNMKESQQKIDQQEKNELIEFFKIQRTIEKEKNKCIQIEHDIAKLNEHLKTLDLLWKPNGRIEELSPEILFHIFKQLFDLKSIINCYNTNLRWKKIVEDVLKNSRSKFVNIQSDKQFPLQMFKDKSFLFCFSKNNHSRRYRWTAKC